MRTIYPLLTIEHEKGVYEKIKSISHPKHYSMKKNLRFKHRYSITIHMLLQRPFNNNIQLKRLKREPSKLFFLTFLMTWYKLSPKKRMLVLSYQLNYEQVIAKIITRNLQKLTRLLIYQLQQSSCYQYKLITGWYFLF